MSSSQIVVTEDLLRSTSHPIRVAGRRWPELVTLAAYSGTVAFTIAHHEPWSDEAQAWQLARSLPLGQLFKTYLRYEGHPGLWHFLLSCLIHLGLGYTGLHWLCGLIALAGVCLLVFFAPFPRYVRLALPFTFFLAYQYAVIARGYVLVPLLLFAIAMAWKRSPVVLAVLLGLLGNVALHACAISGGLALLYMVERRRNDGLQPRKTLLVAAAILVAFYGFALWTVWPPSDLHLYRPEMGESLGFKLKVELSRGLKAMAMGVLDPPWLAIPFWILLWRYLRRRRQEMYLLPIVALEAFSTQYVFLWHAGLVVPALITVLWLAREEETVVDFTTPLRERSVAAGFLGYAIVCQIAWTAYAVAFDYSHPYSPDLAAVRYLAPRVQAGDTVAVTALRRSMSETYAVGLEPYLRQGLFVNRKYPFWLYSTKDRTEETFLDKLPQHPAIVVAEFAQIETPPHFDVARDLSGPKVELLYKNGYSLTHVFCGEQPLHLHHQIQLCHLIFERAPQVLLSR